MNDNITAIVVAIIGSGIITKLIDILIEAVKNKKSPLKQGLKMCLLKCLQDRGHSLLQKDSITLLERKEFQEYYDTYKLLNGDGYADDLIEQIRNKKVV